MIKNIQKDSNKGEHDENDRRFDFDRNVCEERLQSLSARGGGGRS